MDSLTKSLMKALLFLLLALAFVEKAAADAMVTGTVFCDQCKDGHRSLFDYPLAGMRVRVTCDSMEKEETTNWVGSYTVSFEGDPDLSKCYAQLLGGQDHSSSNCGAASGPAQQLRLMFKIFNMAMYTVDSLLSQPAQPMSMCPRSATPPSLPRPVQPPSLPLPQPPPSIPLPQPPPRPVLPPTLPLPQPSPPRPVMQPSRPLQQATACSHDIWVRPEYRCRWRFVQPNTKVAIAFGAVAASRYGMDMNLGQGIQGRGDTYRTLLREATTALLNSYNSFHYQYNSLEVLVRMNSALMGSQRQALMTALRFRRANSGYGSTSTRCNLTPCKH